MTAFLQFRLVRRPDPAGSRAPLTVGGIVASVLLHGLLFTPLMWGGHPAHPRDPNEEGAAASHQEVKGPTSTLMVFQEDTASIHTSLDIDESDQRFILPEPPILPIARPHLPAPVLSWPDDVEDEVASEAEGDQAGHSLMFGRYMGQISARIERAWLRPRSAPKEGSFACRVQIQQDRSGRVQEVTLKRCSQDLRWQASLVKAIQGASPLPAPPEAAVFSNLLTLEFDSDAYVAGRSEEGFEPQPPESRPTSTGGSIERRFHRDGSVDLTIIGLPAAARGRD